MNVYYDCFFFKQKTAYEMRISDWSSDVCSSDLCGGSPAFTGSRLVSEAPAPNTGWRCARLNPLRSSQICCLGSRRCCPSCPEAPTRPRPLGTPSTTGKASSASSTMDGSRSEEHTSELQSLMRTSYAVFCLK